MDGFSIVEVPVAPGPLGILLNGDDPSRPALLEGFAPVSTDGDRGDVERDGRVVAGAQLVGVNEYDFDEWKLTFAEIGQVLRETAEMDRVLRFRVPATLPSPLPVAQPTSVTHVFAAETLATSGPASSDSSFHEIDESEVESALGGSSHLLSPPGSSTQSWSVKDLRSPRSVADPSAASSHGSSPKHTAPTHDNQLEASASAPVDRASRLVAVDVPAGPLGLNLDGSVLDKAQLVGFVPLPDGTKGAVELSGGVLPGSTLVEINGEDASQRPLSEITATLGALSGEPRQLVFLLPDPAELAKQRMAQAALLKKSSRSMPRYVEDLAKRRKLELALVLKFDSTKLKRRECWLLVDAAWMNKWVDFAARDGPAPGPISNDALLEDDWEAKADGTIPGRPDTPREGLSATTHYRGVTPMVWSLFVELHGMNPKLPVLARYSLDAYSDPPRKSDISAVLNECRLKAASLVVELRENCEVRLDG